MTKRQKKKSNGMNSATAMHLKSGFSPPKYAGKDGFINMRGALIPPYSKISNGTPYVNHSNFI